MSCETTQVLLSAAFDGEAGDDAAALAAARDHEAICPDCGRFALHVRATRAHLVTEVSAAAGAPDLATAVLARIATEDTAATAPATAPEAPTATPIEPAVVPLRPRRRSDARSHRRAPLSAAAVFVAAALAAAVLVHAASRPDGPGVAAADLPERVVAAQHDVTALTGHLALVERGWNPAVPERRFTGRLAYAAPETLTLTLHDRTRYPTGGWRPDDLRLAIDEDRWSVTGVRNCPSPAQPACTPATADDRRVVGRPPFSEAAAAPLELIMPVQSFALAGTAVSLPPATVDGRPTVGIETTAAQVGPLLDGLRPTGNLREVHPADPVQLRLDEATLVPVRVTVRTGTDPDREAWAQTRGYVDRPGQVILDLTVSDLAFPTGDAADAVRRAAGEAASTPGAATTDAGFREGALPAGAVPEPSDLPDGLTAHREGTTTTAEGPVVHTRTWSDGRAWLSVAATDEWPGGRLFGDLGTLVRPVDLGTGGTGYVSEDGRRIGLHTAGGDVVVAGSVSRTELVAAAASLGVRGRPVPADWAEAATAGLADARRAVPTLLLPLGLDGFAAPALRVDTGTVVASFAGPGDRSFVLEQTLTAKLPPPVDADGVAPVEVRGRPGRFAVDRGELEWYEGGSLLRLRSGTLSRTELLVIAERMAPP